ncbi:glycosyltransferase family 2 protein [Halpernia sp.]|uniref:glycosyltransferase family 2 protein n=1 Tax=Halpernia sp. TaxID=2782209 RepID=UPI003A9123E6
MEIKKKSPSLFAIVVLYNGMTNNWIQKCFSSLQDSSLTNTIIAIDNNSSDKSCAFIKENFPKVHLIASSENLGFGKANNIGIKYAIKNNADFVFLLNQDAWVDSDTIQNLVLKLSQSPDFGILSPMHLNGNGSALDLSFSRSIAPQYCPDLYSDFYLEKVQDKIYEADFICAAAWLISRECLKKVGGFNPTFYHYGEDDNYVHRLHFHGFKIGVLPTCKIYHDRENRPINDKFENRHYIERNQYLLNISNPHSNITTAGAIKHLQILLLKSFLKLNLKKPRQIQKLLKFLKSNKQEIDNNLNISVKELFSFLQDNNG